MAKSMGKGGKTLRTPRNFALPPGHGNTAEPMRSSSNYGKSTVTKHFSDHTVMRPKMSGYAGGHPSKTPRPGR